MKFIQLRYVAKEHGVLIVNTAWITEVTPVDAPAIDAPSCFLHLCGGNKVVHVGHSLEQMWEKLKS